MTWSLESGSAPEFVELAHRGKKNARDLQESTSLAIALQREQGTR